MHYIVSMSYPNLRDIHHGFHADPAKALAEYNKLRDEAEAARESAYQGGTGRIVTVHEIIEVGDTAYSIDITAAELAVRAAKARAIDPDLLETAKSNPVLLTNALRSAGHFVYLVTPEDIVDHADQHGEEFTKEEVAEATQECERHLADIPSFGAICDCVLDTARAARREKGKAGK